MNLSKKIAFSFILSLLLFAGFTALAYTGLFGLVEARFYNPLATRAALREADLDQAAVQDYFTGLEGSFAGLLEAMRYSFLPNQSEDDILERSRLLESLLEKPLRSIRLIDADGVPLYYSDTALENLPYESVTAPVRGGPRIIPDLPGENLIFAYPFYDALEVHRGTALFTLPASSLTEALIAAGRIQTGEEAVILEDPPGVILGSYRDGILSPAAEIRELAGNYHRISGLGRLDRGEGKAPLVLLSSQTNEGFFTGRIMDEDRFAFSPAIRLVLLATFFLASFLTIFLLFNLRLDPMIIIRARFRGIRAGILEEYRRRNARPFEYEELEYCREAVYHAIKKNVKVKGDERLEKKIDAYLDLAWSELKALIEAPHQDVSRDAGSVFIEELSRAEQPQRVKPSGATSSRTAELEPVGTYPVLLSRPFTFTAGLNNAPAGLPVEPAGEPVLRNKNGVTYVNRAYLSPNSKTEGLSEEFKNLVNSVIEAGGR
jgi:hypothetical protein